MVLFTTLYEVKVANTDKNALEILSENLKLISEILNKNQFKSNTTATFSKLTLPFHCLFLGGDKLKYTILINVVEDLITIDFNEISISEDSRVHRKKAKQIHKEFQEVLKNCSIERTTPLKRGSDIWQYSETGDGRITEDSFEQIIFHQKSKYQDVKVVQCSEFGNILILDGLENLSEEEDLYTPMLLGLNREKDYKDKTVLILGGGDGAALHCLRKLSPKHITMIEIDEVVMQACKVHLRKCCGDSLDQYSGENYQIIVGDCLSYLKQFVEERYMFDIIVSDITDVPIEETQSDEKSLSLFSDVCVQGWEFFKDVFNLSLKILHPDGKILTHISAWSNKQAIQNFTNQVNNLDEELTMQIEAKYIPVFQERWAFCEMRRMQ